MSNRRNPLPPPYRNIRPTTTSTVGLPTLSCRAARVHNFPAQVAATTSQLGKKEGEKKRAARNQCETFEGDVVQVDLGRF